MWTTNSGIIDLDLCGCHYIDQGSGIFAYDPNHSPSTQLNEYGASISSSTTFYCDDMWTTNDDMNQLMLGSGVWEYVGGIWANAVNIAATYPNDRYGASISCSYYLPHFIVMDVGW